MATTYKFKFESKHLISIVVGIVLILINILFLQKSVMFMPFMVLCIILILMPFFLDYFSFNLRQKEIEERFPDYVRNLVSAVKSGMPISKAISYVARTDYGALNYYVKKMAHQIEWNIPVRKVLTNFANELSSPVIKRAISTVLEAEKSGGNIEDVLGSITDSLLTIKKLKEERKASIQGQITQSYVIFFIFLGVLLTIQNVLIPYLAQMEVNEGTGFSGGQALAKIMTSKQFDFSNPISAARSIMDWFGSLSGIFMMLAVLQAFFAGIVLGKMSEGDYKSGLKHSLFMMSTAIFILTLANSFLNITL